MSRKITKIELNYRQPTLKEKVMYYERYFSSIHEARTMGDSAAVVEMLDQISKWYHAYSSHNGTLSKNEIQKKIRWAFWDIFGKSRIRS